MTKYGYGYCSFLGLPFCSLQMKIIFVLLKTMNKASFQLIIKMCNFNQNERQFGEIIRPEATPIVHFAG